MEFLYVIVALVLIFDFINGFHDSANSIATVVSTRVLTPFQAVTLAAFFNFAAIFVFSLHVATTMGKGVVNPDVIDLTVIAGALSAAIAWNLITWWLGLPSSSSHTLVGGLIGATIIKAGSDALIVSGILKIVAFIFISPALGMILSYLISLLIMNIARNVPAPKADKFFRRFQLFTASLLSLGHGGNDAQKSMGIIWVALIVTGHATKQDPIAWWIVIACYSAIALGTLMGGWRIIKTMGQKISKLRPFEAVCSDTASALTLFGATELGIPVSTTHTVTGAILGSGLRKGVASVKWNVTTKIFWAWILTIPVSALLGIIFYCLLNIFM